jgi:hypothetical protein
MKKFREHFVGARLIEPFLSVRKKEHGAMNRAPTNFFIAWEGVAQSSNPPLSLPFGAQPSAVTKVATRIPPPYKGGGRWGLERMIARQFLRTGGRYKRNFRRNSERILRPGWFCATEPGCSPHNSLCFETTNPGRAAANPDHRWRESVLQEPGRRRTRLLKF